MQKQYFFYLLVTLCGLFYAFSTTFNCEDCTNGIDDDGDGLIDCADPQCDCTPNPITICYIPDSRCEGDCGYTFDGSKMIDHTTPKVLNPNNFGENGVVKCPITLHSIEGTITVNAIQSAACNIFFIGAFGGVDCTGQNPDDIQIPFLELNAVREWSLASTKNLAIVTQNNAYVWGYDSHSNNSNPNVPSSQGVNSSIFMGAFGVVTSFFQGGCYQGGYATIPNTGAQVLATDSSPNNNVVIAIDNATNDLMIADVDICTSLAGISAGAAIINNNDVLFANIIATACTIVGGEDCTNGIDDDGDGLIDHEDDDCYSNTGQVFATICEGEAYHLNGTDYFDSGSFADTIPNGSFFGCDSIIHLQLTVTASYEEMITAEICDGENFLLGNDSYSTTGMYQAFFSTMNGCDSIITLNLNVFPNELFIDIGEDVIIDLGSDFEFSIQTNAVNPEIEWIPETFLNCGNCLNPVATPTQSTIYEVVVMDENGCKATDSITIQVLDHNRVFVPNAFSPNNDGFNDFFTLYADKSVELIKSLKIFHRWGGEAFNVANILPNDLTHGWNGYVNGQLADNGIYVYIFEILKTDGSVEIVKGDVVLIK